MSPLRAVKPTAIEKRLKMFMFGNAGVGKTFAAIQFPRPYLIDTERGAENDQYVKALDAVGGVYFPTTDLDEIISEVRALMTEKHEFRTVVIDPMTTAYNDACEKAAKELAAKSKDPGSDGTEFGRHKGVADRRMKVLVSLLLNLDMNVIITSHQKTKWEKSGDSFKEAGTTFDCYAKLDYLFDLVVEVQKRGKDRVGVVRKTRIESFPEGDVFPFNYMQIASMYGNQVLERQAEAVELATPFQVSQIRHFVTLLSVPPEQIEKWNDKANAEQFEDYPAELAGKILAILEAKVRGEAAAV